MRTLNFCRFRPFTDSDGIDKIQTQVGSPMRKQLTSSTSATFQFDQIFQSKSTQVDIFNRISQLILQRLDQNAVISILLVGPPRTGKTFTIIGEKIEDKFEEGILFLTAKYFLSLEFSLRFSVANSSTSVSELDQIFEIIQQKSTLGTSHYILEVSSKDKLYSINFIDVSWIDFRNWSHFVNYSSSDTALFLALHKSDVLLYITTLSSDFSNSQENDSAIQYISTIMNPNSSKDIVASNLIENISKFKAENSILDTKIQKLQLHTTKTNIYIRNFSFSVVLLQSLKKRVKHLINEDIKAYKNEISNIFLQLSDALQKLQLSNQTSMDQQHKFVTNKLLHWQTTMFEKLDSVIFSKLDKYDTKIQALKFKIRGVTLSFRDLKSRHQSITAILKKKNALLTELETQNSDVRNQNQSLKREISSIMIEFDAVRRQLSLKNLIPPELEKSFSAISSSSALIIDAKSSNTEQYYAPVVEELNQQLFQQSSRVEELEKEVDQLQQSNEQMLRLYNNDSSEKTAQIKMLTEQVNKLSLQLEKEQTENSEKLNFIETEYTDRLKELHEERFTNETKFIQEKKKMESEITALAKELEVRELEYTKKLRQRDAEADTYKRKCEQTLADEIRAYKDEIEQVVEENVQIKQLLQSLQKDFDKNARDQNMELNHYLVQLHDKDKTIDQLHSRMNKLTISLNESNAKMEELVQENNTLQLTLQNVNRIRLDASVQKEDSELGLLRITNDEMEKLLTEKDKAYNELESAFRMLEQEYNSTSRKLQHMMTPEKSPKTTSPSSSTSPTSSSQQQIDKLLNYIKTLVVAVDKKDKQLEHMQQIIKEKDVKLEEVSKQLTNYSMKKSNDVEQLSNELYSLKQAIHDAKHKAGLRG